MPTMRIEYLSEQEITAIHDASLAILGNTGVRVEHDAMLDLLAEAGARVDRTRQIARLPERLVMESVARAGKRYVIYGRDPRKMARFGYGDLILISSPGQYAWVDMETGLRHAPTRQNLDDAICLGDALPHISIVGAMAVVEEVPVAYRDVFLTAQLVKGTTKPCRCYVANGRTARYVLEIFRTVAGGDAALRQRPMIEAFYEPISPLTLPHDGLDILAEFVRAGQPASFGPMAMTSGTAPATLAGTLAQENAEVLAGIVVCQILAPGTPVTYGGIPHILDPRTNICSFGSPEQALMGVAMVQIAHHYGFPVYINVGITDAKVLDAQAGMEKSATLILGAMAGADMFGHAGICGTDHGGSLSWLFLDNELMAYVKRIARGFEVTQETLGVDVVGQVGPGGNYLVEDHTLRHFRNEIWVPGSAWTRATWDGWEHGGRMTMEERIVVEVKQILASHRTEPLEESLVRELDRIVDAARRELA
jgi:trimethylamine---corrinoid protein Co-methyltransferase